MSINKDSSHLTRLLILIIAYLSVFAQAQASLGVKQDRSALSQGNYVWTAKLQYGNDVNTLFSKDEDLYAIAKQGWDEMQADIASRRPVNGIANANTITKKDEPGMMGLIAVGNTIYMSSSMKGGRFIYGYTSPDGQPPRVRLALDRCQMALATEEPDTAPFHTNKASCAEIIAMHQYYLDPAVSAADKADLPSGVRAAAYGNGGNKKVSARPYEPCGGTGSSTTWGCSQFLQSLKIVAPPTPSGDLATPSLAPVDISYIPVCES